MPSDKYFHIRKIGALKNVLKFTRNQLYWSLFLINLQVSILKTLLKEKSPMQVFSDDFCKINKTPFLQYTSRRLLPFYGKYFSTKIVKRKRKKMETACKETTTYAEKKLKHYLHQVFISIYSFKNFFITNFSASHDTLKAQVFRNNAIPLRIIYYRKLFLTFDSLS